MDEYESTLSTIEEMRSRYDSGFSSSDKETIKRLYYHVCGKTVRNTGCNDCYRDAFIEIRATLKRLGTMPKTSNYVLKNGVLFHPQGTTTFYVLDTITDEVAETELAKNPDFINKLAKYPTDYAERAKARAAGNAFEEDDTVTSLKKQVALLKGQLAEKEAEIAALKASASTDTKETPAEEETKTETIGEEAVTTAAQSATPKARKTATKK